MNIPRPSEYPSTLTINNHVWTVKFKKKLVEDKVEVMGVTTFCDDEEEPTRLIEIALNQHKMPLSNLAIMHTFVHETLHAMEYEFNIKIPHKAIYALDQVIVEVLLANF